MLLTLERMQVNWVTVCRARLHKFRKNFISFPQDVATFFDRVGLLRQYRIGDRVNSNRGLGEDVARLALSYQDAAEDVRRRFHFSGNGA
jgi:hypothetical protein